MTIPPAPPVWAVERRGCEWDNTEVVMAQICPLDGSELQIVERTGRDQQSMQLWDFAVMLQVREEGTDEGWVDVVRIDTAHGFVHIDRYEPRGGKVKDHWNVPAECRDNLDRAWQWARDYVWDVDARLEGWG